MAPDPGAPASPGFWREALANSAWLSADRLARGVFGLAVMIGIGRFLGPERYGQYSYAVAFVTIFTAFGSLANEGIIIRGLVRGERPAETALGSAGVLRAAGGLAGMACAVGTACLLPRARAELGLIAIIAAGLLLQPFDLVDFWFQSRLSSRHAVMVRVAASLAAGAAKVALALRRAPLPALAWLSVAEAVLVAAGLLAMYHWRGRGPARWRVDAAAVRALLRESWPMAATSLLVILFLKLDQIMLAWLAGFRELGVYVAAVRLVELWNFIPLAVMPSLYPAVVALRARDAAAYRRLLQRLLSGFFALALLVVLVNALLGRTLLGLLFGAAYTGAAPALAILSLTTIFHYSSFIRAQWLLIEHRVVYHLLAASVGVATLAALDLLLIPRWGGLGAALAAAAGYAVAGYGTSGLFRPLWPMWRMQTRAFRLALRAPAGQDGEHT